MRTITRTTRVIVLALVLVTIATATPALAAPGHPPRDRSSITESIYRLLNRLFGNVSILGDLSGPKPDTPPTSSPTTTSGSGK